MSAPPTSPSELASIDHPVTKKTQRSPARKKANPAASPSQRPSSTGVFANGAFDIARLTRKARQLDYSLDKVIAKASSYRDEVITPAGMYCLSRGRTDHQAGQRKYAVTECSTQRAWAKENAPDDCTLVGGNGIRGRSGIADRQPLAESRG